MINSEILNLANGMSYEKNIFEPLKNSLMYSSISCVVRVPPGAPGGPMGPRLPGGPAGPSFGIGMRFLRFLIRFFRALVLCASELRRKKSQVWRGSNTCGRCGHEGKQLEVTYLILINLTNKVIGCGVRPGQTGADCVRESTLTNGSTQNSPQGSDTHYAT